MSYPGSKAQAGVWQRIIGQMPPHNVYVEPFFGSGFVFWQKRPATVSIVIDLVAGLLTRPGREPRVIAVAGDAISVLPDFQLPPDAVVYCDPPYLLSTRKGRRYYQHELEQAQHAALLALLQRLPCRVLLSGYPSDLYSSQLQSWRCMSYRTRTRGRTVTECLWANFPEPAELHDWRYAGRNFRERLHLKRLAKRWLAKLRAMPARKRAYLASALLPALRSVAPILAMGPGDQVEAFSAGNGAATGTANANGLVHERQNADWLQNWRAGRELPAPAVPPVLAEHH